MPGDNTPHRTRKKIKEILNNFLRNKSVARNQDIKELEGENGKKPSGITKGYVAEWRDKDLTLEKSRLMFKNVDGGKKLFLNEYVAGPLYRLTLYDRTPLIAGVTENNKISGLRSKYIENFKTIAEFTGSPFAYPNIIGPMNDKLKDVEGGEKIFACILLWGEYDIHAGNLGVREIVEEGRHKYVFAKIDHGWSAAKFFTDPNIMMENLANNYTNCNN